MFEVHKYKGIESVLISKPPPPPPWPLLECIIIIDISFIILSTFLSICSIMRWVMIEVRAIYLYMKTEKVVSLG